MFYKKARGRQREREGGRAGNPKLDPRRPEGARIRFVLKQVWAGGLPPPKTKYTKLQKGTKIKTQIQTKYNKIQNRVHKKYKTEYKTEYKPEHKPEYNTEYKTECTGYKSEYKSEYKKSIQKV